MRAQTGGPGSDGAGELRIPFETFKALEDEVRRLRAAVDGAPVEAALGQATITVAPDGVVQADVEVRVHGDGWVSVPLLPAGTAVESAFVENGGAREAIALSLRGPDLVWSVRGAGARRVSLRYRAVAQTSAGGGVFDLPLPAAAAMTLSATLPGEGLDVALVPGEIDRRSEGAGETRVEAVLPKVAWARLAWGRAGGAGVLATGAAYVGAAGSVGADGGLATIRWRATFGYEVASDGNVWVPVAAGDVAMIEARVDDRPAVLAVRDGVFQVQLVGRGPRRVSVVFETAVAHASGPTGTTLWTPRPPIASVTLALPGDKEVVVEPAAGVVRRVEGGRTEVVFNLPPRESVALRWSEALADSAREVRVNAELFHVVRADEGVLSVMVSALMEVARGKAQRFVLAVPGDAVVNAVRSEGLADWRLGEPEADGTRPLVVVLDREVTGEHRLEVDVERLVADKGASVGVPLVVAREVHRQRGMVVLVRGSELEVAPETPAALSEVGENQIPEWLRTPLAERVTHTYKFVEPGAALAVKLAPFVREAVRLHAGVDTLLSIGEGVLRASAVIEVDAKAGTFIELGLTLPDGINVLTATAPSLREHRVIEPADGQPRVLMLTFTREMQGLVRVDVAWEKVLAPGETRLSLPLVHVRGAVVEEGEVAVEALTAVEVKPIEVANMLPLDVEELPQHLVLRTTHPILLAYHYVHADPPASLTLSVKRHDEITVKVATIDSADYQTLWTRDGVALTRARYVVRNRGKQFLRVRLPAGAEVWSAELAGQPVKPARDDQAVVLVPLVGTDHAFTVELVYATTGDALGFAGRVEGELPSPDLVETSTTWSVYLPDDVAWGDVVSNMTVVGWDAAPTAPPQIASVDSGKLPLRLEVPAAGRRLVLTKLLTNVQPGERASFSVAYRAPGAGVVGAALVFAGALGLGLLLLRLTARGTHTRRALALGLAAVCAAAIVGGGVVAGAWLWILPAALVIGVMAVWRTLSQRRARLVAESA